MGREEKMYKVLIIFIALVIMNVNLFSQEVIPAEESTSQYLANKQEQAAIQSNSKSSGSKMIEDNRLVIFFGGDLTFRDDKSSNEGKTFANSLLGFSGELNRFRFSFIVKTFSSKKSNSNYGIDLFDPVSGNYLGGNFSTQFKLAPLNKNYNILEDARGWWLFFDLGIVKNQWETSQQDQSLVYATIGSLNLGVEFCPFHKKKDPKSNSDKNEFQFSIKLSPSIRFLSGDIILSKNKDIRKKMLETDKLLWLGAELLFQMRINTFRGYLRISGFKSEIAGFGKIGISVGIEALAQLLEI